jgi:nucleoside-diphosphate-sugar epimerase
VRPVPRNIYGVTKAAAEDVCELVPSRSRLPCLVLRTSRFFPEEDDDEAMRVAYEAENAKANEFLYRRVDLEDVVAAHLLALERVPSIGFARYIISATTPFQPEDVGGLRTNAPDVVRSGRVPEYEASTRVEVADVPDHRSRVRQRSCASRARVGASLRLPNRAQEARER